MSSRSAARTGEQLPRVELIPKSTNAEDGEEACFLGSSYGMTPDEWQERVICAWLARSSNGKLAAGRCGLAVPRQNGKNAVLEIVELFKIVVLGRRILHTAHEVKTARKAFLRLASFFENERHYPELAVLVKEIRKANGQEAVVLTNGGSVEFVARTRGSGRGFTVDDLVCDEAQELTDEQLEALLPTISSAPSGDPQVILTGTPPPPGSVGTVFLRYRQDGVAGKDSRLCWLEWSVEPGHDAGDRAAWYATNPSLGHRLNMTVVEDEHAQMSADGFLRERLGFWPDDSVGGVLDLTAWAACKDTPQPPLFPVVLAVETTVDRSQSVIVGVSARDDGLPQVAILASGASTGWVAEKIVSLCQEHPDEVASVVIDGRAAAAPILETVERVMSEAALSVALVTSTGSDMAEASAALVDALAAQNFRHPDDAQLTTSARTAVTRDMGDGAWAFSRRKGGPTAAPLVAFALALWEWRHHVLDDYDVADSFG